ncbi:MAG: SDR family NAD(P)-dependent oxidoreductase [Candidatus Binatia bacterium]
MEFKDQVVLITGVSSGIGQRLAIDLAARGATVAGCGRSQERLRETLLEMRRTSPSSAVHVCDVGDPGQVKGMVQRVLSEYGKIDILINNAGFGLHQSFIDSPLDSIEGMVRTNFLGAVYCTKEVLPSMVERRSGHIVNISSVSGKIGTPNMASYCATKFALIGLTESLYHELRPLGIHLSVVCPGPVRTKMRLLFDQLASGAPKFLVLKTDEVSRAVIRSIQKEKFEVVIPLWLALACFFKGLMPNAFQLLSYQALRLRSIHQIRGGP